MTTRWVEDANSHDLALMKRLMQNSVERVLVEIAVAATAWVIGLPLFHMSKTRKESRKPI